MVPNAATTISPINHRTGVLLITGLTGSGWKAIFVISPVPNSRRSTDILRPPHPFYAPVSVPGPSLRESFDTILLSCFDQFHLPDRGTIVSHRIVWACAVVLCCLASSAN